MKNVIIILLSVLLAVAVVYILYQQNSNQMSGVMDSPQPGTQQTVEVPPKVEENQSERIIGGDKDDHGCLVGAGYSWCESKQKCLRAWEEPCEDSQEQAVIEALAQKHSKDLSEVSVTISKQDANCVRGGVEFAPGGPGNAGMFLAVKTSSDWKIAFDGNGTPDCNDLQNYNCSSEVLSGLCD